jgi:glycosyltransferase involved in cell wall biosynthesis
MRLSFFFIIPKYIQAWNEYIKKCGLPELIHCQNSLYAGFAAIILRKRGINIPIIITEHSSAYSRGLVPYQDLFITKMVIRNSDLYTTVSKSQKLFISNLFKTENIEVLNNQVDRIFECTSLYEINKLTDNSKFTFITIGHLDENKNQRIIILAFSQLLKKINNIKLQIVGDGPCEFELKKLTSELNIQDSVEFCGRLNRQDLLKIMQKSSVLVISSNVETFGVTALEALFLGKPCVSTKCGGVEDFLNPDNSVLVEKNNFGLLADGMEHVYINYSSYDSIKIKSDIQSLFGEKVFFQKVEELYNLTLNNFKLKNKKV